MTGFEKDLGWETQENYTGFYSEKPNLNEEKNSLFVPISIAELFEKICLFSMQKIPIFFS